MKQTNADLLRKFETMTRWMIEDTYRAMFQAKANFLVALGLLNYTEIIGSFINPTTNSSGERFDAFFERMGDEYTTLLRRFNNRREQNRHIVYDDLRCGLTHEYTIKRKRFIVYNHDGNNQLNDQQINNLRIPINGSLTQCTAGVMHSWENRKGVWHFIDPKYWLDFRIALDHYWNEIQNARDGILRRNFIRRAREINFLEFRV